MLIIKGKDFKSFLRKNEISQENAAKKIGVSRQTINNWCKMDVLTDEILQNVKSAFPNMEISSDIINKNASHAHTEISEPNSKVKKTEGIPLIPIEAMAGYGTGEMQILEYECERFIVPVFKDAEFLIAVRGSSMYPKYNSGDIVACKKLPLDTFFQWNKVYVLDTTQGALIKRISKCETEDCVLIVSDNAKYLPFELHRSEIHSIALVVGVIRLE